MPLFSFIREAELAERRRFASTVGTQKRSAITAHRHLYDEHDFLQLLYLERRRCERSQRALCLVLLEGIKVVDRIGRENAFYQLFQMLRLSIRETDIIGWYRQKSTLAVLFSDLNSPDQMIVNGLRAKVSNALSASPIPDLPNHIGISVHVFPSNNNDVRAGTPDSTFYPEFPYPHRAQRTAHILKRVIDVLSSVLLLGLFSPLFALVALAIKLSSKGPVIFRQVRIGQQRRAFRFCKFRSMYVDSDARLHKEYVSKFISHGEAANPSESVYKITDDPRVTPVGRFLRKTSIDELPQLWNVLLGDMSLVGPRPPLPYELECYALWHHRRILEVKPGITGLWQVTGRSKTTFNDMVRLDLRYVQQWSIWLDFKILLQTPKAVLMGDGAY